MSAATLTFQSAAVVMPAVVDGWSQARPGGALAHPRVGGGVDYTHTPRLYRVATIRLVLHGEGEAAALDALLATEPYFDIATPDIALANGRFVPTGDIPIIQHDTLRGVWLVSFDASEDV